MDRSPRLCDPGDVRSEPLDDAATHLSELAEEVESTRATCG